MENYCEHQVEIGSYGGGLGSDGGMAPYMVVAARHLVPLDGLSPVEAAPLTDAALTPYRAIKKALPVLEPDHYALVIGLGGLGQYGVKLLTLLAGCPIIVVDVHEQKLKLARELGAAYTFNGTDGDLAAKIREVTKGQGVNASFDFVGNDSTLALAISTTRSLGKVSQIGLAGGAARMKVLENTRFEVQFEATLWGTVKELREVIALAESGKLVPIAIERAPLERINEVYGRLKRGEIEGRAVITPAA
jgi:propanol-preferring alcohol dehydrogenase